MNTEKVWQLIFAENTTNRVYRRISCNCGI